LIARNRLIAALCPPGTGSIPPYSTLSLTKLAFGAAPPGIIVVETEADGGAMYAARAAFASGRPVYAVENRTSGYTALLAMGAVGIVMSDE